MFSHTPNNDPDQPPLQFCATCFKLFSDGTDDVMIVACDLLSLLGNYCPICYECYSDNDYESKVTS